MSIILERNGSLTMAFASLRAEGKNYIAVADLPQVPFAPGEGKLSRREREGARTDPQLRVRILSEMQSHFPEELVTRTGIFLIQGLSMEPFEKGKYTAYFLHDWRVSAEGWHDEIAGIVAKEAKKQPPAKEGKAQ